MAEKKKVMKTIKDRKCPYCGYSTNNPENMKAHKKSCPKKPKK